MRARILEVRAERALLFLSTAPARTESIRCRGPFSSHDLDRARLYEPSSTWSEVSRSPQRKQCQEHALVLQAVGIAHGIVESEGAFLVVVRSEVASLAREQIERYEKENVGWPPRETAPESISQGVHAAIVYGGLLVLVFLLEQSHGFALDWWSAGRADAALIRRGQWWRSLTALTLHTDVSHLAGNLVFGALFGVILAQSLGVGLAWIGFVLTGALGNLVNAWIQPVEHLSVGASTAVFGALGLQVAYEWMRRRELGYGKLRRFAPLIVGAVWLGMFGVGGSTHDVTQTALERIHDLETTVQKVDVMAHVTGFASGAAFGIALGLHEGRIRLRPRTQAWLAISAPILVAIAWWFAFRAV